MLKPDRVAKWHEDEVAAAIESGELCSRNEFRVVLDVRLERDEFVFCTCHDADGDPHRSQTLRRKTLTYERQRTFFHTRGRHHFDYLCVTEFELG